MNKIKAFWDLFKAGQSVAEPAKWKSRQVTATVLAAVILAVVNLLAAFGVMIPVDTETANLIAGGLIAIVNVILTITTTEKIGVGSSLKIETTSTLDKQAEKEVVDEDKKEVETGIASFDNPYSNQR